MVREIRTKRTVIEHIDRGVDYPIACWDHKCNCYSMDDLPGRYMPCIDPSSYHGDLITAYDVWTRSWKLFRRISDDELFRRIELAVEDDIGPF